MGEGPRVPLRDKITMTTVVEGPGCLGWILGLGSVTLFAVLTSALLFGWPW